MTITAEGRAVAPDTVLVSDLRLIPGEKVTIEVSREPGADRRKVPCYSLRGTVISYESPFDPLLPDEAWESELFPNASKSADP